MKIRVSKPLYHILFWLMMVGVLTLIFGQSWGSRANAFFFISMLLPIVMASSYFFSIYLVPRFLLKNKYFFFGLYFLYLIIFSLYLQMMVIFLSFIYLANLSLSEMRLGFRDVILLAVVMYLIVFVGSFFIMIRQLADRQKEIESYRKEEEKRENAFLELLSNRQLVRIPFEEIIYIESLSDYIKVHVGKGQQITSKEKISVLTEKLPGDFIRIHRSFIVNKQKISRYSATEVEVNGIELNIGRTYKKEVANALKSV